MGTSLVMLNDLISRMERLQFALKEVNFSPELIKTDDKRYTLQAAADMVGRSVHSIRRAEEAHQLPPPEKGENGRRQGYTLAQVNQMRDVFGTRPIRAEGEEPVILGIQNLKGGIAKSTTCTHLAQYLARKGYRVLLIDCDSQASATSTFGYLPDREIGEDDTLAPYLRGEKSDLRYAVRPTYWDGLYLIPANLYLYQVEYELWHEVDADSFMVLSEGIDTIKDSFDVILLDPPPALGMIPLNVIPAVDALIVPMAPGMFDFYSTLSFLNILRQNITTLERHLGEIDYDFIKLLVTRMDENKSGHVELVEMAENEIAQYMLRTKFRESAEISTASNSQRTVYELEGGASSTRIRKRCINILDAVCGEIEALTRSHWPSHAKEMRSQGLI